jgi:hypothetical protein
LASGRESVGAGLVKPGRRRGIAASPCLSFRSRAPAKAVRGRALPRFRQSPARDQRRTQPIRARGPPRSRRTRRGRPRTSRPRED